MQKHLRMIRPLFITAYQIYLIVGLIISIIGFSQHSEAVAWWSCMFAHILPLVWFLYLKVGKLTNHSFASLLITIGTGVCTLIALADGKMTDLGLIPFIWASISLFGWLVYHLILNKVRKNTLNLKVGDHLPDTFPVGKKAYSLFIFQQGKWSAFCAFQEKLFQDELGESGSLELKFVSDTAIGIDLPKMKNSVPFQHRKQHGSADSWLPLGVMSDENRQIIAIHQPKDLRNRPQLSYFLRFLEQNES